MRRGANSSGARLAVYGVLALVALLYVVPLVWMASVSLTPTQELEQPGFVPDEPTVAPYRDVARSESFDYLLYARNTLIIAGLSLVGMVLSSAIAAYGFARIEFPGRKAMFAVCLATMMIPFPVMMVPAYLLFRELGWIGTFRPLWVPAWFGSAFNIFLLRQFFMSIPRELEECATLDGCSRWGCFWRIILPLSKPALAVVALFHVVTVWNDLVGPLIYLSHQEHFTLALGLQFLQSRAGNTPANQLLAATAMIVLPLLILFLFAQRAFVRGIATTGIKG